MSSYISRFEAALGDLSSSRYAALIIPPEPSFSKKTHSPVTAVIEELVADCETLKAHRGSIQLGTYAKAVSILSQLNRGDLTKFLAAVDDFREFLEYIEFLEQLQDSTVTLPFPKEYLVERVDGHLSKLLELLKVVEKDDVPLLGEALLSFADFRYLAMTSGQVVSTERARNLRKKLWSLEAKDEDLEEFISLMKPLLRELYPEGRIYSFATSEEVQETLARFEELLEERVTLELWSNLTAI